MANQTPYFLWDYNLSEDQLKQKLSVGTVLEKQWLIARILTSAHYEDIWRYLKVNDVVTHFANLRMRPTHKAKWSKALRIWGYAV